MNLEPVSELELQAVEGGMIRLAERVEVPPQQEPQGGLGTNWLWIQFTLTVIE